MERLEPPTLGGAELLGQGESRELLERAADLLEPFFERDRARRERRGALRVGADRTERLAEEPGAIRLVGGAIRAHEEDGLARLEVVALDRRDEGLLVLRGDGAESVGERGPDRSVRDAPLDPR